MELWNFKPQYIPCAEAEQRNLKSHKSPCAEAELRFFKPRFLCGSRTAEIPVAVYFLCGNETAELRFTVYSLCGCATVELQVTEYFMCCCGTSSHRIFSVRNISDSLCRGPKDGELVAKRPLVQSHLDGAVCYCDILAVVPIWKF